MMNRDRALIFTLAVLVRGIAGWIFFGSVDVTNAMLNSGRLFGGIPMTRVPVPYLPGAYHALVWVSGMLATNTALPLTFCYKLFPILFDGALAVAVHDAMLPNRNRASTAGILYALSPISVIVTALHTQWDSISFAFLLLSFLLVRRRDGLSGFVAGASFVLGVLVKPIAPVLLPLLFPAPTEMFNRDNRRRTLAIAGGMLACTVVYIALLLALGEELSLHTIDRIVRYAGVGAQLFGIVKLLPTAASRLYSLLPLLLLVPLYWKRMITREEAVVLFFAVLYGTSGLSAQYMLWLVPFALIASRERFLAVYTLITGFLLVIYYQTPGPGYFNMENLGTFAPLRSLEWLAPANTYYDAKVFLFMLLGGVVLPGVALTYFVIGTLRVARRSEPVVEGQPALSFASLTMPIAIVTAVTIVVGLVAWQFMYQPTFEQFGRVVYDRVPEYAIFRYKGMGLVNPGEPSWVIAAFAHEPAAARAIDAATIGYVWVLAWVAGAWAASRRTA